MISIKIKGNIQKNRENSFFMSSCTPFSLSLKKGMRLLHVIKSAYLWKGSLCNMINLSHFTVPSRQMVNGEQKAITKKKSLPENIKTECNLRTLKSLMNSFFVHEKLHRQKIFAHCGINDKNAIKIFAQRRGGRVRQKWAVGSRMC